MINYISNSFLCSTSFSGPAGCVDQAISEGINDPIANELEANLGIAGSIIAGVICTALKIVSVTLSTFLYLATLSCYFNFPDLDSDEIDDSGKSSKPIKIGNENIVSGPESIVNSDMLNWIQWVEVNIRKKREDHPRTELNRLEKLGYVDLKIFEQLDDKATFTISLAFKRVYAEALTIKAIFNKTHYAFVHSQADGLCVIPYLIKEIVKRENLQGKTLFDTHKIQLLRDPKSSFPKEDLYPFLKKEEMAGKMIVDYITRQHFDHQLDIQNSLLSVDSNLFNADVEESAAYYCAKNSNVYPDQKKTIANIFKAHFNLDDATIEILSERVSSISGFLKNKRYFTGCGNLFLYLLPKEDVLKYAYLSRPFGIPYSKSEPELSIETLNSLNHDAEKPGEKNEKLDFSNNSAHSSSQYRLYIPAIQKGMEELQDPAKRPMVYLITAIPKEIRKEMKKQIREIVGMAEAAAMASKPAI